MMSDPALVQPIPIARGVPAKAPALLCVAPPSIARTGVMLRQISAEARGRASTLMLDFSGVEGELIASGILACPSVIIDTDSRSRVFPLGGWSELPEGVASKLQQVYLSWLLPDGRVGHGQDMIDAAEALAWLPFTLPRTSLYAWWRFFHDRGYRRGVQRALRKQGQDPRPLQLARPGTGLARALIMRIESVLGHDDSLDRLFPYAEPGLLSSPARKPELRIVRAPGSGQDSRQRIELMVFTQVLTSLAALPKGKVADWRGALKRLIVVEPPSTIQALLPLVHRITGGAVRTTVVLSPDSMAEVSLASVFGNLPSIAFDRAGGFRALAAATGISVEDARTAIQRQKGARWFYVPQAGYPPERWCGVQATKRLPRPEPRLLTAARSRGAHFLVDRARVIGERRRLERAAEGRERRRKTEDLLERVLAPDRLASAWRAVRRNAGAPGVDRVTIEAFSERWQLELDKLRDQVTAGKYTPQPYLRCWVPKASGGERPLGIAAVRDRVLMAATAEILSEQLEPVFSDHSYAYRPGRGAQQAVLRIATADRLRDGWAVIADISAYFDSVDHDLLKAMLREHVADERILRLIGAWVANPVLDQGQSTRPRKGVPQGSPASPVLSNLYLTPLDRWAERRGLSYARYADDFVIIARDEAEARALTKDLAELLASTLRLELKPNKTQFVPCSEGFAFLGFQLHSSGLSISPPRLADAGQALTTLLDPDRKGEMGDILKELDTYVRGFRGYFSIGLPGPSRQLAELERHRRTSLEAYALAHEADAALLLASTERFVTSTSPRIEGEYGGELEREDDAPPAMPEVPAIPTSLQQVPRTRRAVRQRTRDAGRPVAIAAAGHVSVFGNGAFLSIEGERLVLRRRKKLLFEAPVAEVRSLHTHCFGLVISTPAMRQLAERGVPVLFSAPGGPPWGLLRSPAAPAPASVMAAQLAAHQGQLSVEVARELIRAKLRNQERMLRYLAKYKARRTTPVGAALKEAAAGIRKGADALAEIQSDDVAECRRRIFAAEGRAGSLYWGAIQRVLGERFQGRKGRNAKDPINMALNYGYGILYSAVWAAVLKASLDPGVGLLHASVGDRGSLVFDLIEPFRIPAVDKPLLGWLNRGSNVKPNKQGMLRTTTRVRIATLVSEALARPTPWGGTSQPLSAHLEDHAVKLRDWLQGGPPLEALRIRW